MTAYKRLARAHRTILAIRPRVTLEQANIIRDLAGELGNDDEPCYELAIDRFKELYTITNNEWTEGTMQEVDTKKVGGKTHARGDFLVVDDPEQVGTWHLPVKLNGKPDRALAGAAWAALFSPGGFRGNKYEGPGAAQAKSKLKALYKAEGWDMPASEVAEMDDRDEYAMPMTARTFADLLAAEQANEAAEHIHELTYKFQMLISNVMGSDEADKVGAIRAIVAEYLALVEGALGSTPVEIGDEEPASDEPMPEALSEFAESFDGVALRIVEDESVLPDTDKRKPAVIDFQIIKPGAGNKRNNNYYTREMLEKNAGVFAGADIFMTDHVDHERGERTKVGRIRKIAGFTDDGAPIGRAVIYDPDVAEKARNRNAAGELGTLECSIYASGKAEAGEIDGVKYNIVTAIEAVKSVDLVSKAGAGGKALRLIETDTGGDPIVNENEVTQETAPVVETEAQAQAVEIQEQDATPECGDCKEISGELQTSLMEGALVDAIIKTTNLPEAAKERLMNEAYTDHSELARAIEKEIDYVKSVTGGVRVFGQGASKPQTQRHATLEEIQKVQDGVNKRWLGK